MNPVDERRACILRVIRGQPLASEEEIGRFCKIEKLSLKRNLRWLYRNVTDVNDRKSLEIRKIGLQRIADEKNAEEARKQGEPTEYDLLEFLKEKNESCHNANYDKLAVLLSKREGKDIKKKHIKKFIDRLIIAMKDMKNPRKPEIRGALITYGNTLKRKPDWVRELLK